MANASRAVEARAERVEAEVVVAVAAVLARVVAAVEPHQAQVAVVSMQAWMVPRFRKKK